MSEHRLIKPSSETESEPRKQSGPTGSEQRTGSDDAAAGHSPAHAHGHYLPAAGRDWLLPLYDPMSRLLGVRRAHARLTDQAGIQPGHRVLEIGSGTGNLLLLVKRRYPDATVVGLDPDPKALARAARKARRKNLPVQLDRGFASALPYPDGSYDRVLSSMMFHHLEPADRLAALREVRRVLAPGGSLHLVDFGGSGPHQHGFVARRLHRSARLHDNLGDRIPALMREAGFPDPRETGQYRAWFGPLASFVAHR